MSSAARFATHEVSNQPPPLEHTNLFEQDRALAEAAEREGAGPGLERLQDFGAWLGTPEAIDSASRPTATRRSCAATTGSAGGSTRSSSIRPGTP